MQPSPPCWAQALHFLLFEKVKQCSYCPLFFPQLFNTWSFRPHKIFNLPCKSYSAMCCAALPLAEQCNCSQQCSCSFALHLLLLSSAIAPQCVMQPSPLQSGAIAPLHCTCSCWAVQLLLNVLCSSLFCRAVQLLLFDRRNVPLTESNWDAAPAAIALSTRVLFSLLLCSTFYPALLCSTFLSSHPLCSLTNAPLRQAQRPFDRE